jgi:hypothetical protein
VKGTDQFIRVMRANEITEATRHAYDFRCIEECCDAQYYWKRPEPRQGNTEHVPAEFFKKPSSRHYEKCPRLHQRHGRIFHEDIDFTTQVKGATMIRINFPMGSEASDKHPEKGYLRAQQREAAHDYRHVQPYASLSDALKFIEEKAGKLDSEVAGKIILMYQGEFRKFGNLLLRSDQYEKLYHTGREELFDPRGEGKLIAAAITIVKPSHETDRNEYGSRRFVCNLQSVHMEGRWQNVQPTIVCSKAEPALAQKMLEAMEKGNVLAIASRPFVPYTQRTLMGLNDVYMRVHNIAQLAAVDSSYWVPKRVHALQPDLFDAPGARP